VRYHEPGTDVYISSPFRLVFLSIVFCCCLKTLSAIKAQCALCIISKMSLLFKQLGMQKNK
jgi:hypothetical protein